MWIQVAKKRAAASCKHVLILVPDALSSTHLHSHTQMHSFLPSLSLSLSLSHTHTLTNTLTHLRTHLVTNPHVPGRIILVSIYADAITCVSSLLLVFSLPLPSHSLPSLLCQCPLTRPASTHRPSSLHTDTQTHTHTHTHVMITVHEEVVGTGLQSTPPHNRERDIDRGRE